MGKQNLPQYRTVSSGGYHAEICKITGAIPTGLAPFHFKWTIPMQLLIATRNLNKLAEIRQILNWPEVELLTIRDLPDLPDVEEDGTTFEENALKKAGELARLTGHWTLADDSGLEVAALDNAPGVNSARYAGGHGDDSANNRKLLHEMQGQTDRRARFRCVLALVAPDGRRWTVEGVCCGTLLEQPRGTGGFGYDPLFVPEGASLSFGELSAEEKNRISHRAKALAAARTAWAPLLTGS